MGRSASFGTHPVRGRFNAGFFTVLDSYINWLVRDKKRKVFSALPREVVEIGPGVGANFGYMPPGCRVIAIEPNPYMHGGLLSRAARHGIDVEICSAAGAAGPTAGAARVRSAGSGPTGLLMTTDRILVNPD
jgi:hypothetical protein